MRGSKPRTNLWAPRRIITALLIVVGLSVGTVAAAGFGETTDDHAGPLPSSFIMAEARIGDRGNYTWDHIVVGSDGQATVNEEHELVGFEWLPAKSMRDKDGRLHDTNTLHQWGWQRCDDCPEVGQGATGTNGGTSTGSGWERYAEPVYAIDRTDLSIVSYSYISESATDPNQRNGDHHMLQSMLLGSDDGFAPNCGSYSSFQGKSVPLEHAVQLFAGCRGFSNLFGGDERATYKAVGVQPIEGRDAVLFTHDGSRDIHVWYDTTIPVPVRIAVQRYDHHNEYDILRLMRFARGTDAVTWGGAAPMDPAPTWGEAPLVDKLPDESGVEHVFSARTALTAIRENSTAAGFFRVLDRGYVSFLDYREDSSDGDLRQSWDFAASDGKENPAITVTRHVTTTTKVVKPSDPLPVPLPVPVPGQDQANETITNVTIEVTASTDRGGSGHPDPSEVPTTGPTVASMLTRWTAFASDEYQSRAGNVWGLRVICMDPCSTFFHERWAGHQSSSRSQDGSSMQHQSVLQESTTPGRGHEATLHESTYRWSGGSAAAPVEKPAHVPTGREMQISRDWVWVTPSTYIVTGTTAVAVFVGLVYFLWPAVKSVGFLGLFSRVQRPEALDQPNRAAITALVEANPGIHFQEIGRRLSLGHGTVEHHLRKLVHVGILTQQTAGGYHCYFPKGAVDRRLMVAAPLLKADGARAVLSAVAVGQRSGREISAATGLDPGTVSYHVKKLAAASLVALERQGREVRVGATDLGRTALSTAA